MSAPIELVLASFDGEHSAETALKRLKELEKDGVISIANAAVLVKHKDGKASFKETEDVRAPAGAVFGAIVGGLVGLLGGPAGVIVGAAAGAATGGVAAHQLDMGFSDKNLKDIEALLPNGSSAIIALVTLDWVDQVVKALEELDARLWRQGLNENILKPEGAATVIEGRATAVPNETSAAADAAADAVATSASALPPADAATPSAASPQPSAASNADVAQAPAKTTPTIASPEAGPAAPAGAATTSPPAP